MTGPAPSGGGGFFSCCRCYITTATSIALGLPDDNPTLRTLRWFRDEVLLKDPEGRADVELYYSLAPSIVHAIEARPDSREVYLRLYHRYLEPAVASINARRFPTAHAIYREMVAELIEKNPVGSAPPGNFRVRPSLLRRNFVGLRNPARQRGSVARPVPEDRRGPST